MLTPSLRRIDTTEGIALISQIADGYEPPTKILRPGEPVTTDFTIMVGGHSSAFGMYPHYKTIDIALIASFRPFWAPFWNRTRAFRFEEIRTSEGTSLRQIPAGDIEVEYDKVFTAEYEKVKSLIGH
jgi:hypothetical protein